MNATNMARRLERVPERDADLVSAPARGPSEELGHRRLRVLIVTEDDPIYVVQFFQVFFAEYPADELEVVGLTVDDAFHEPLRRTLRRMMRFYGLLGTARQGARYIGGKLSGGTIEALARRSRATLVTTPSVNDAGYLERVRALRPDVVVSVAGPEIFSKELLEIAPLGCINVHSGRLPAYRGMLPTFWQMLRGEPFVAVTVHRMVEKLDAGDVLAMVPFPIRGNDSLDRVIRGTKREGARVLIGVLRDMRRGQVKATPLDMTEANYFRFPAPSDVRAFRRRGHRLL